MESTQFNSRGAYQTNDTDWEGVLAEKDVFLGANSNTTIMSETDATTNNGYADEMHMDLLNSLDTDTEQHIPGHPDTDAGGVARDLAYLGGYPYTSSRAKIRQAQ
jgi:hypothetical protein